MKSMTRTLEVVRWGTKGTVGQIELSAELYQSMAKNHNELRLFGQHVYNGGPPDPGPQMLILWAEEIPAPCNKALPNIDGWL